MPQAISSTIRSILFMVAILCSVAPAALQSAPTLEDTSPYPVTTPTTWFDLTVSEQFSLTDMVQAFTGVCMLVFTGFQVYIARKARRMDAATARLAQVRFRLETLLRGGELPLSSQSLVVPADDKDGHKKLMKDHIVNQICGDEPDGATRRRVEQLVEEWFKAERAFDQV